MTTPHNHIDFNDFQVLSNKVLMENPLIQKIANDTRWTVSDLKKRPVDAKHLLETYNVRNARIFDEPYPLVDIHQLNADENLDYTNRTYRLQAQINKIIVIDVEPSASDELLQFAANFPAHLTEISTNGGVHLLIELPDKIITPENEYLLTTSVIKSPNNDYEIICNDHYITFSKRLVLDKPIADFENNADEYEQLEKFLQNIVEMDAQTQENRLLKQQVASDFDDSDINIETIKKLLDSTPVIEFMERQAEKSVEDFNNDHSSYEGSITTACAGHIHRFTQQLPYTQVLKDTFSHMTENDWIYAGYMMAQFIIPNRAKHDEYRNGLPWLLYLTHGGWTYIQAMELKKKQEEEGIK